MTEEPRQDWEGTPLQMLFRHYQSTEETEKSVRGVGSGTRKDGIGRTLRETLTTCEEPREDWEGTPLKMLFCHYQSTER